MELPIDVSSDTSFKIQFPKISLPLPCIGIQNDYKRLSKDAISKLLRLQLPTCASLSFLQLTF
jgi:hypothetical protein